MMTRLKGSPLAVVLVAALVPVLGSTAGGAERHLALLGSEPAADSTVASPTEITLWFTQAPQPGTTQIRLLTSEGALVPTGEATADPEDATAFSAKVERGLAPGRYSVAWRAMAADGHVVSAEFDFGVRTAD
ncbi:MAG: copper resistance CopC family protein [Gemmatimonadota bacterium]